MTLLHAALLEPLDFLYDFEEGYFEEEGLKEKM
jgi:hypothetical protein